MQGCDGAEAGGWWDSGRGHPPVCTEQAATGARPHKPPLTTVRDEGGVVTILTLCNTVWEVASGGCIISTLMT